MQRFASARLPSCASYPRAKHPRWHPTDHRTSQLKAALSTPDPTQIDPESSTRTVTYVTAPRGQFILYSARESLTLRCGCERRKAAVNVARRRAACVAVSRGRCEW